MEELFFAVKPIWWEGKIALSELYLVLFLCIFFSLIIFLIRKPRKARETKNMNPNFPHMTYCDPKEREFALKTLDSLKSIIGYFYTPEKTHAHTVHEIGTYLFDSEIMTLASKLEASIYLGKPLEERECHDINTQIQVFIEKAQRDHM